MNNKILQQSLNLQSLLNSINVQFDSNITLDYAPQYGGYMLFAVPKKLSFLRSVSRLTYKEMANFLWGILCGVRAYSDIIFSPISE